MYVAGGFSTLLAKAPRSTSRAQGSAVTSSIPGATWPAYLSARVAAVSGAFHQHCALAARKFCRERMSEKAISDACDMYRKERERESTSMGKSANGLV